jgi:hypothetical protein
VNEMDDDFVIWTPRKTGGFDGIALIHSSG